MPNLKYKDTILIEIPKITIEFAQIANHLDSAWKQYSSREYDKVLTDCRKALEALKTDLRNRDFVRQTMEEKEPRIDWEKITGNKDTGEIIGIIFQKLWAFDTPGAHTGKAINREDANFALMSTHAIIDLAIKKIAS